MRCQLCSNAEVKNAFLTCVLLIWCLIGGFGFTNQSIERVNRKHYRKKKKGNQNTLFAKCMRSVPAKFGGQGMQWDQHNIFFIWSVCLCEAFSEVSPPFARGTYWCPLFLFSLPSCLLGHHCSYFFLAPSLTSHSIMAVKHTGVLLWKIE